MSMLTESNFFKRISPILAILIILGSLRTHLDTLDQESLWLDEAWTAWVVRHDEQPDDDAGIRAWARYTLDSGLTIFEKLRNDDVHPPLYFASLGAWTFIMGDSVFMLRFPSLLIGLMSLASIYVLGRYWFNHKTGIIAMFLLASSGIFAYYSQEARQYTLLLTLVLASTIFLVSWIKARTLRQIWGYSVGYGLIIGLGMLTHYVMILVIFAQLLILLYFKPQHMVHWRTLIPYILGILIFSPWLPSAITQFQNNTAGPASAYLPSDLNTLASFLLVLTGGSLIWWFIPIILGRELFDLTQKTNRQWVVFTFIWLLIPLIALFILNAQGFAVLQLRYLIPIIPAYFLLWAYFIGHVQLPNDILLPIRTLRGAGFILMILVIAGIVSNQISTYSDYWATKPRWQDAVIQASDSRQPLEPALVAFNDTSPIAYYVRQYPLLDGMRLDLGWRYQEPDEVQNLVEKLDITPIWVMMDGANPATWDVVGQLVNDGLGISYRDSVQGTLFYQFTEEGEALTFKFANTLQFTSAIGQLYSRETDTCDSITLQSLVDIEEDSYQLRISLTHGFNTVLAQASYLIPQTNSNESIVQDICWSEWINWTELPQIPIHIRLEIINVQQHALYLTEGDNQLWGNMIVLGVMP